MKKLALTTLLVIGIGGLSAQADGFRFHRGHYGHFGHYGHYDLGRSHWRSSVSFYFGPSPWYGSSWYGPAYYGPTYGYSYSPRYYSPGYVGYPAYGYSYSESRPNYAVSGTLLGALTGGLIGNSIHHQGWEGAGIGAAAGLLLGSLAEHSTRSQQRVYYSAPTVSYAQPAYSIPDPPTVKEAPEAPEAPKVQEHHTRTTATTSRPASTSAMSSANKLFGR